MCPTESQSSSLTQMPCKPSWLLSVEKKKQTSYVYMYLYLFKSF